MVVFSGEHDVATKHDVQELLTGLVDGSELVVADFSRALFVDSSILGVLLTVDEAAQQRGVAFRLQLGTAAIVRRAFEICGLYGTFEIARTPARAAPGAAEVSPLARPCAAEPHTGRAVTRG